MSKKKKTKQQKIIAELRHKITSQNQFNHRSEPVQKNPQTVKSQETSRSFTFSQTIKTSITALKPSSSVSYIYHDLLRTSILTGSIVVFELILFMILKKHILILPIAY